MHQREQFGKQTDGRSWDATAGELSAVALPVPMAALGLPPRRPTDFRESTLMRRLITREQGNHTKPEYTAAAE